MNTASLYQLPYQTDTSQYFALIEQQTGAVMLDSGHSGAGGGRYDICSAWPAAQISLNANSNLSELLAQARLLQQEHTPPINPSQQLPFVGGIIGYLGYSAALADSRHNHKLTPASLAIYQWALINDHHLKRCYLVFHPKLEQAKQQQLIELFSQPTKPTASEFSLLTAFQPTISSSQYQQAIAEILRRIEQGKCSQVNYTQTFVSQYTGNPWLAFQALRQACPTPFAAFLRIAGENNAIISASPERFIQVNQQQISSYPIKGTRPRGVTRQQDQQLAEELTHSSKDRQENLLTVALMQQELATICQTESIKTDYLCRLHSFTNVHHLISCVSGTLKPKLDALAALQACFPAGSISGTPKDYAVQLIDQLEQQSREIYCGSIFYLSACGNFDSSVTIRTLLALQGEISCWGGGGITAASNWQDEYQESVNKIQLLLASLEESFIAKH